MQTEPLNHLIIGHKIDVFIISEAGIASENVQFYQLNGYTMQVLQRGRQVAAWNLENECNSTIKPDFVIGNPTRTFDNIAVGEFVVGQLFVCPEINYSLQ